MSHDPQQAVPSAAQSSGRFRFRIVHLFYVMAVVASSLATFGGGGIVLAILIVGFWAVVFTASSRPRGLTSAGLFLLLCCLLACCLLPAVQTARVASLRVQCLNHLKMIGLALYNYHDVYGCFPPAYVADENGRPMHSWRVLILPFLEGQTLYDQYDFAEPWDGPNNARLLPQMPDVFACPSRPGTTTAAGHFTHYVAVVDGRGAWPGASSRRIAEIRDGTSNTILVVESCSQQIPWMEPRDPSLPDTLDIVTSTDFAVSGGHRIEEFFYVIDRGRNILMADASVHFLGRNLSRDAWSNLLTIDDGVVVSDADLDQPWTTLKKARLDNWFRLALFLLITLLPLPWVWIAPRRPEPDGSEVGRSPAELEPGPRPFSS